MMASIFREASAQIVRDSTENPGDGESRPILGWRINKRSSLYLQGYVDQTGRYIKCSPAFAIQKGV